MSSKGSAPAAGHAPGSGSAVLSGRDDITQAMARVRAVLDLSESGRLEGARKELFEYVAGQLARFERSSDNPIVAVVDHIGNYWRNWLLVIVRTGPYRPSTIQRLLAALDPSHPISQRMLTLSLRLLERDGIIAREVFDDGRRHVEYSLTPLGRELSDGFMALLDCIDRSAGEVAESRAKFDAAQASLSGGRTSANVP
ncbi:helix-turn-helix domain-containing protein [Streptomyces sp. NBC_00120]|uniref:winged helix-turn-helix transcriptional regulator n=1 Tax=Streptomyces sp. NBC_00120 TaxID=2975660 RepID=UPI00225642C4|nr:helix-turn-helix domain-containing protein [Streptomyces sp. NBC_00120]MCX5326874.1 helix-turn-helix transcriptional regulator [Streptomyces sp. NBC_00120]